MSSTPIPIPTPKGPSSEGVIESLSDAFTQHPIKAVLGIVGLILAGAALTAEATFHAPNAVAGVVGGIASGLVLVPTGVAVAESLKDFSFKK